MTTKSKIQQSLRGSFNTIAAIILAAISMAMPSTSQAQEGLQADLNHDGTVNISDVSYLINIILGKTTDAAVEAGLCPNTMHPHIIDLGLPSGTKWTCCNVGASSPELYGGYYAWGETLTKEIYSDATYCHYDSENSSYLSIGDDIAGTIYDVATVKWGDKYRMPSYEQYNELINNCSYEWTTLNGVNGCQFTGPSGGTIFMPAAGYRWGDSLYDAGSGGSYWSSTQNPNGSYGAYYLSFDSGYASYYNGYWYRYLGQSVRPVAE